MDALTPIRRKVLEHVRAVNSGVMCGARFSSAELIEEAAIAEREGQIVWRKDHYGEYGRWLTASGNAALADPPA